MARTERPHRCVAVSAAARSLAADSGLGYLAGHSAQARVRSLPLRALALLEGVRHRGRRRRAGPPDQRHDVHVGDQRAPETGFGDVRPHLWTFFEAVRTRKPVVEDVVFGHNAALACHMANESYFRKGTVSWDEASKTIKGG